MVVSLFELIILRSETAWLVFDALESSEAANTATFLEPKLIILVRIHAPELFKEAEFIFKFLDRMYQYHRTLRLLDVSLVTRSVTVLSTTLR